jgi:rsbT co-antagonist protein RsbR
VTSESNAGFTPLEISRETAAILDAVPLLVYVKQRDHRYVFVNRCYADAYGLERSAIIGRKDEEIHAPDIAAAYHDADEALMASATPMHDVETRAVGGGGEAIHLSEHNVPWMDADGNVLGMVGAALDITARKDAERALHEREAELRAMVERQRELLETIRALWTPVLPIHAGILVLPIVGAIDAARSAQLAQALLESAIQHEAEFAILDVTGVPSLDAAAAGHLLDVMRAARLLGVACILVGLSPRLAQTLIELEVSWGEFPTHGNLRAGVEYALGRQGRKLSAPRRGSR